MRYLVPLTLFALAACAKPSDNTGEATVDPGEPEKNAAVPAPVPAAIDTLYSGKWVGPEGLVLNVVNNNGGLGVDISNRWTLDDKGEFKGRVTSEGLRFVRNGEVVIARRTDGDATGMKWLAGKQHCLTVKSGSEAYCHD